ncbi:MAG: thioredoxin family protein [Saprospiraceae bacterium]|nr:thioredoxin family protein [Saprospiraceae bacterium]
MKALILPFFALPFMAFAQLNFQVISHKGDPILLGEANRAGLVAAPFGDWFRPAYDAYQVDKAALANADLAGVDLLVFMGTWCEDSQRELPHFYKILDHLGHPEGRLRVVALDNHPDRRKTSPDGAEKGWNIEYVPTFIFLKNGKELGRIVETPAVSLGGHGQNSVESTVKSIG